MVGILTSIYSVVLLAHGRPYIKTGLAILIAPITGEKELTLVHRDDAHMVGDS